MNLDDLNLTELRQLVKDATAAIEHREKTERLKLARELDEMARAHGYSLQELCNVQAGKSTDKKHRAPAAIKYRHPKNPEINWTGRGRKPAWVEEFIDQGGTLDQLLV